MTETITIEQLFAPDLQVEASTATIARIRSLESQRDRYKRAADDARLAQRKAEGLLLEAESALEAHRIRARYKIADLERQIQTLAAALAEGRGAPVAAPVPPAADPRPEPPVAPPRPATNPSRRIAVSSHGRAAIASLMTREPPDINGRDMPEDRA